MMEAFSAGSSPQDPACVNVILCIRSIGTWSGFVMRVQFAVPIGLALLLLPYPWPSIGGVAAL
jgi:hypothetical protein